MRTLFDAKGLIPETRPAQIFTHRFEPANRFFTHLELPGFFAFLRPHSGADQ